MYLGGTVLALAANMVVSICAAVVLLGVERINQQIREAVAMK